MTDSDAEEIQRRALSVSPDPLRNPTLDSLIAGSQAEGAQNLAEQRKSDLQAHKQLIERTKLDHELSEARKDSDARRDRESRRAAEELARDRLIFRLTIVGIALGLIAGCIAGFVIQDEFTQRWGQGLITLIFGGLVGYFTGRHIGD